MKKSVTEIKPKKAIQCSLHLIKWDLSSMAANKNSTQCTTNRGSKIHSFAQTNKNKLLNLSTEIDVSEMTEIEHATLQNKEHLSAVRLKYRIRKQKPRKYEHAFCQSQKLYAVN